MPIKHLFTSEKIVNVLYLISETKLNHGSNALIANQFSFDYSSDCRVYCISFISVGSFLWLGQSRKDLFCIWDEDLQMRPLTVQLPADVEIVQLSACRDALWGLDQHGRVHIRTLTANCPTGLHWTPLDLSQLGMHNHPPPRRQWITRRANLD